MAVGEGKHVTMKEFYLIFYLQEILFEDREPGMVLSVGSMYQ